MEKLSAVIITYNEEKNIARCLESLTKVADEIIVVDSFSDDKTKEICLNYDVCFIENKFEGHIEQKNFAATKASYNLILSVDADEVLSVELQKSILQVKKNPDFDGYYFNRMTNYCGKWIKHCGWYPDKKHRLWKKGKAHWGGKNPHDKIIMHENSTTKYLKGDLFHYSYHSVNQHVAQINNFTEIVANEDFKNGKKSSLIIAIVKSKWKFLKDFFIKLGFLDGYYGYIICKLSAKATFIKYIKLNELYKKKQNANNSKSYR